MASLPDGRYSHVRTPGSPAPRREVSDSEPPARRATMRRDAVIIAIAGVVTAALNFALQRAAPAPTNADEELAAIKIEVKAAGVKDDMLRAEIEQWQRSVDRRVDTLETRISAVEASRGWH